MEQVTDLAYTCLKGLKEWNFGCFEGEPEFLNPTLPYGDFFVPFGGEGEKDFQQRVADSIMDFVSIEESKTIFGFPWCFLSPIYALLVSYEQIRPSWSIGELLYFEI